MNVFIDRIYLPYFQGGNEDAEEKQACDYLRDIRYM
jgi:hypothetical protein